MIAASLSLSTLGQEVDDRYYLAKQKFKVKQLPKLKQKLTLTGEVKKVHNREKLNYLTCRTTVKSKKNKLIDLSSTLIKRKEDNKSDRKSFNKTPKLWRNITPEEVYKFSQYSSDPNSIHLTDQPIVQGMLLLLLLEDYLAQNNARLNKGTITYLKPIRSGEQIRLAEKNNTLLGIVNNQICFKLTIKEEL
ncbi:hypothetical protein JCM16358_17730 [Halanaerocella petrolearia]